MNDVINPRAYRSGKEMPLFVICLVLSLIAWLLVIISIVGIFYIVLGLVGYLIFTALLLASIKGNGVRIGPNQLPELYARLEAASRRLGLRAVPDAYLLNHRAVFNAFATRYLGRNFVVLYAELLEHCEDDSGAIDFIISHEVAHVALGHLSVQGLLLPGMFVPWIGPAYSRAREYSCDRVARAVVGSDAGAVAGLTVLAAGGKYGKRLNVDALLQQRLDTGRFWQAVVELNLSHPFLSKRVAAVIDHEQARVSVGRNPFAYLFAPLFSFSAAGTGAASQLIIVVAIVGILAAIAIPNFLKFQQRAQAAAARASMLSEQNAPYAGDAAPDEADLFRQLEPGRPPPAEVAPAAEAVPGE